MDIILALIRSASDQVLCEDYLSGQIGMVAINTRINDGDAYPSACRYAVGIVDPHRIHIFL